jgi:hypothetical protein
VIAVGNLQGFPAIHDACSEHGKCAAGTTSPRYCAVSGRVVDENILRCRAVHADRHPAEPVTAAGK